MTDGCGFANLATLRSIKEVLELDNTPTAVQCRIAGAKVCLTFTCHLPLLIADTGVIAFASRYNQELPSRP